LKRGRGVAHSFNCTTVFVDMCLADTLVFSLSGYRYLGDGGTDRLEILHYGTYWSRTDLLPFWGRDPLGPQIRNFGPKFWLFDREYLKNGKSQRYVPIRA